MHRYYTDMFDGIEFGARTATYAMSTAAIPSTPTPTRTRQVETDNGVKTVPVTPTDEVREAVKDGKVKDSEKTVFERPETAEVVRDEQDRLREAVHNAGGDRPAEPSQDNGYRREMESDAQKAHRERVEDLGENHEAGNLEELDRQIEQLEGSGHTAAAESVRSERNARAEDEQKVLDVVEDRESLIGTLEAEKLTLESSNADREMEEIKADAQHLIDQFNENHGQYYEGNDLFGDDWDTSEVDFDRLANRFDEDPDLINDFVSSQGINDGDLRGKSESEALERIGEYDSASDRTKVRNRYLAAQDLVPLLERYNELRNTSEDGAGRIAEIDSEVGTLRSENESDLAVLSQETLDAHDHANQEVAGILPEPTPEEGGTSTEGTGTEGTSTDGTGGEGTGTEGTGTEGTGTEGTGTEGTGAEGTGSESTGQGGEASTTRTVDIDYNEPARRQEVLQAAQQASLLPAEHTTFNDAGEAVYTVQPGDSYWRISDMSDGRPPNEFDNQHFIANVNANSERLGRDPRQGLIHPNEELVIQNRSIAELVALLQLPTTEDVADEVRTDTLNGPR